LRRLQGLDTLASGVERLGGDLVAGEEGAICLQKRIRDAVRVGAGAIDNGASGRSKGRGNERKTRTLCTRRPGNAWGVGRAGRRHCRQKSGWRDMRSRGDRNIPSRGSASMSGRRCGRTRGRDSGSRGGPLRGLRRL